MLVGARALVERQFGGTRYCTRLIELLGEARGVVAISGAVALFDEVAGASGVVKLHALIGEDEGALREASSEFGTRVAGRRLILCELPDDAPFAPAANVLIANGFFEESRAEDFVAYGIALRFLVRTP